jgi:hypothetical protein
MTYWEQETQQASPLRKVDTTEGRYTEAPPAAGLVGSTGQTNQNSEITYVKTSSDANVFTLAGENLPFGPYTLTAPGSVLKIKSDGADWWPSA